MPNGNGSTVYMGRATNSIYMGRASPSVLMGSLGPDWVSWPPRSNALCAPVQQCCCKGPVNVGPGETASFPLNWAGWVAGNPGFQITKVTKATLYDMSCTPPAPADPDVIQITSGLIDCPTNGEAAEAGTNINADAKELVGLIPPVGAQVLIKASEDAVIGRQYKLTICMAAHDCDGRWIEQCDCLVIVIAEC